MRDYYKYCVRPLFLVMLVAASAMQDPGAGCVVQESAAPYSPHASLRRKLQEKFDQLRSAGTFPGGTAGFALADGMSFGLATGLSDKTTARAMTPRDLMLQGSVGKTYVSAVALQLVQEGKIALDEPISRLLGKEYWFNRLPNANEITIRMLMNHTSGLVRYEFNERFTAAISRGI